MIMSGITTTTADKPQTQKSSRTSSRLQTWLDSPRKKIPHPCRSLDQVAYLNDSLIAAVASRCDKVLRTYDGDQSPLLSVVII